MQTVVQLWGVGGGYTAARRVTDVSAAVVLLFMVRFVVLEQGVRHDDENTTGPLYLCAE